MGTPDLLTTVGFDRRKLGPNGKELGYYIQRTHLARLLVLLALPILLVGVAILWAYFEIRLERRNLTQRLHEEEYHAAAKLARVEMELWSHFRNDVRHSHEAVALLNSLNASYDELTVKLQNTIGHLATNFGMAPDKAGILAETAMHVMADHRKESIKHTRTLIRHLVEVGNKTEDGAANGAPTFVSEEDEEGQLTAGEEQAHELRMLLGGFWESYKKFQKEFAGPMELLHEGSQTYNHLKALQQQLQEGQLTGDDEVHSVRQSILESLDISQAEDTNSFASTLHDLIEVLLVIPRLPLEELSTLEHDWRLGKKDAYSVLTQLHFWEINGKLPSRWFEHVLSASEEGHTLH